MDSIVNYLILVVSVILVLLILLQSKGGGLGNVFGGDGNAYQTRRGFEKSLFYFTITLAVIFVGLSIASVLLQ